MTDKPRIRHIHWRTKDGWTCAHPRFAPGPRLRLLGYVSYDLKHKDGTWFTLDECKLESLRIEEEARTKVSLVNTTGQRKRRALRKPPRASRARTPGYVYAMIVGPHTKIGFSAKPWVRIAGLMTSFAISPVLIAVPGTKHDESRLHWKNKDLHIEGEWFTTSPKLMKRLMNVLSDGGVREKG